MAVGQVVGRVSIKVLPDTSDFRRQLKRRLDAIEKSTKLQIKAQLDSRQLDREARDAKREMERKLKDTKAQIKAEMKEASIRAAQARMAALARRRNVEYVVRLNKRAAANVAAGLAALSGARVLSTYIDRLGNSLRNLDKSIPILGTLALAIAGLSSWALTGASNLFALSASLAQIGGVALALPGVFAGIAIGLGATFAVLKDFNTVLPNVKTQLAELQDRMSAKFWSEAKAPIAELVDDLLPRFGAGLEATSTKLGTAFGKLATSLRSQLAPLIGPMFAELNRSIEIAGTSADSLARIIANLGKSGSQYLPRLSQWVKDIAARFDEWLNRAAEDGSLKRWIDDGIFALGELARVAGNIGSILAGIARAAQQAGGVGLTGLADTLGKVAAVVSSPAFQSTLVSVLNAAHLAMSNIATTSGPAVKRLFSEIAETAQTVLPMVGSTIGLLLDGIAGALAQPAVQKGITDFFGGLLKAVQGLTPALGPMGRALGAIMTVAGQLAAQLGPVLGEAFSAISETLLALAPALGPVIELLGQTLVEAIKIIGPELPKIAAALASLITPELLAAVSEFVQIGLAKMAEYLPQLTQAFITLIEGIGPVLPQLVQLGSVILPIVADSVITISGLLPGMIAQFFSVVDGVRSMIGVFAPLSGLLSGSVIGVLVDVSSALAQLGVDALTSSGTVGTAFNAIVAGSSLMSTQTIGNFSKAWSTISSATTSFVGSMQSKAAGLFSGLAAKAVSGMSTVKAHITRGWNNAVTATGVALGQMKSKVAEGIGNVIAKVGELPGKAASALGNLGGTLVGAGKALIGGFISGITSRFGEVQSKLASLTSKLPDWKGPFAVDSVILEPAGRAVIGGFIKGLEDEMPKVRKSLQKFTLSLGKVIAAGPDDVVSAVGKMRTALGDLAKYLTGPTKTLLDRVTKFGQRALTALDSVYERLTKRLDDAKKKLADLRKEAADYAATVAEKIIDTGNVTETETPTFHNIFANLVLARNAAQKFAKVLADLKKQGLNKTALDQIATAGPEAGLAAAEAILASGKKGIASLNVLQAQLAQAAGSAGKTAADAMYENGIRMAEGLVKGLQKQEKALRAQMDRIALMMVQRIKAELDIHSPSRVFERLGAFIGKGLALGVDSTRAWVESSLTGLVDPTVTRAQLAAAAVTPAGAGSAEERHFHYHAAENHNLPEEDVFEATKRARFGGW